MRKLLVCSLAFLTFSYSHAAQQDDYEGNNFEGITFDSHPVWTGNLEQIMVDFATSATPLYEVSSKRVANSHYNITDTRRIFTEYEDTSERNSLRENHPEALLQAYSYPQNENFETHSESGIKNVISIVKHAIHAISHNFNAVTLAESHSYPPDSMGAVGPTQFIAFCNGRIKSFNKTTGVPDDILNIKPNEFFSKVLPIGSRTTDPRIRYDRLTDSWILLMIDVPQTTNRIPNNFLLAVTRSKTITSHSSWSFYSFSVTSSYESKIPFADFPTLGIDSNALYIGANIFENGGNFINAAGYVIPKEPLLALSTLKVTAFPKLIDPTKSGPRTPQGVDAFEATNKNIGYFIGTDNKDFGLLSLRYVMNPGTQPTISPIIQIPVLSTADPLKVPHKGNTNGVNGYLDAIDDRLSSSHIRKSSLYTSHNIGVNDQGISSDNLTRTGCRWYKINISNPDSPTLDEAGTLYQPGNPTSTQERFYWIPSVMTNGLENMILGCSTAGELYHADAAFAERFPVDPPGTLRAAKIYTDSDSAYNPPKSPGGPNGRRWGDYSHISLDPSDNMTMWSVQEYCNAPDSYGVNVISILAPPPPDIDSISPSTIPVNTNHTTLVINGSITSPRTAYYDPDPSFPNRLQVNIQDVKVLSLKVISRNQLEVVVSTIGTSSGTKTITITNPDGQLVQAVDKITVSG